MHGWNPLAKATRQVLDRQAVVLGPEVQRTLDRAMDRLARRFDTVDEHVSAPGDGVLRLASKKHGIEPAA